MRALEGPELAAYHHIDMDLARRVRVVRVPWLPSGAHGLTLGRLVLVTDDSVRDGTSRLMAHELVHVDQYARLGVVRFLRRYVADYLRHRRRGLAHHDAYLAIGMEQEARAGAKRWARLDKP